jgi:hypothetical protein
MKTELPRHISKSSQISNFMKIRPVGAEFFHAVGRKRPVTKLIVVFGNFATVPKNGNLHLCIIQINVSLQMIK